MSRIRMRVNVRNETDEVLTHVADEVVSGEWTPGWVIPERIEPRTSAGFANLKETL